jgi:hypothetical protein
MANKKQDNFNFFAGQGPLYQPEVMKWACILLAGKLAQPQWDPLLGDSFEP